MRAIRASVVYAWRKAKGAAMDTVSFLDELQARIDQLIAGTPAADLQKNLRALLAQQFARLDLVTREEFDTQARVLARTREKLAALETRVAALEARQP
jgi:BMFP domain-containing protein YqiC